MNIITATKTAKAVQDGQHVAKADMQAAFDRLSMPDQLTVSASKLRAALWDTGRVNLDD
ncbi:MAG: hypothetical protein KAI73_05185 [Rhodospirillaceae bacterium]|nr:hypothetical protein [Rhodospirillaceae bacterium]